MVNHAGYEVLSNRGASAARLALQAQGERLDLYVDALKVSANDRVLDVGCGGGNLTRAVSEVTGAQVWGIDLDAAKIAHCRQTDLALGLDTHYLAGDVTSLDLSQKFSTVFCRYVLMYALPDQKCVNLLDAMARRVAPGGRLVLFEADINFGHRFHPPLPDWAISAFDCVIRYYRDRELIDWRRGLSLVKLLGEAGYDGVSVEVVDCRLIRDGQPASLVAHDSLDIETLLEPALRMAGREREMQKVADCYRDALCRPGGVCYTPVFKFTWVRP